MVNAQRIKWAGRTCWLKLIVEIPVAQQWKTEGAIILHVLRDGEVIGG